MNDDTRNAPKPAAPCRYPSCVENSAERCPRWMVGACGGPSAEPVAQVCTYPDCKCPFDAPADPAWCARGLPHAAPAAPVAQPAKPVAIVDLSACDCRNSVDDCDYPDCKAGRAALAAPAPGSQCAQCKKAYRHGSAAGCPKCAPGLSVPESEFCRPIAPAPAARCMGPGAWRCSPVE